MPTVRRSRLDQDAAGPKTSVGAGLRTATVEDVLKAVEEMSVTEDGSPVKPATVSTYVASVKSFLGFAHRVGLTRFNAAPLRFWKGVATGVVTFMLTASFGSIVALLLLDSSYPPKGRRTARAGRKRGARSEISRT